MMNLTEIKSKLKKLYYGIINHFSYIIEHVEVDDTGFFFVRKSRFGSIKGRKKLWKSIVQVNAYQTDCYGMMLEFIFENKRRYNIDDTVDNWDDFVKLVSEKLQGFNLNNFRLVESFAFGMLPCWDLQKKIGNIFYDKKQESLVWEEDGQIFYKLDEST